MKKRICFATILILFALSGCSNSNENADCCTATDNTQSDCCVESVLTYESNIAMKKSILASITVSFLILATLLTFTACSNSNESENLNTDSEKTEFNIGYLNSTAHLLAFVAEEEGYFDEEGLDVTLTQFSSAAELASGLESEKLDVAFIGSVPTLTFQSTGHDHFWRRNDKRSRFCD